jgi:hypothetical protein
MPIFADIHSATQFARLLREIYSFQPIRRAEHWSILKITKIRCQIDGSELTNMLKQ